MSESGMDRRIFVRRTASVVGASSLLGVAALEAAGQEGADEMCEKPRRSGLEARMIANAWRDARYRRRLLENPGAVFARELGTEIPADLTIRVVEERPGLIYFVLPVNPNEYSEKRLAGRELELAAAGIRFDTPCEIPSSMMPSWFHELEYTPRSTEV